MKSKKVIIDKRNKIQKEFQDLWELRKQVANSTGIQDYFQETLEGLQKQLDLIDWILN